MQGIRNMVMAATGSASTDNEPEATNTDLTESTANPPTSRAMPETNGNNGTNHKQHTSSNRLEDQAATAALYVTNQNERKSKPNDYDFLDSDHKLSSAGAAASLKYANPKDLPSYPSAGLKGQSAAGAAASLGWQNQKSFQHWKPDPSASASTAAMLAKDYKMAPMWKPEASAHGAKAALLAHKADKKVDIWQPQATPWGNSAATQAMAKGNTLSPRLDYGHTDVGRKGSLIAATGAMSNSRKRAGSTPAPISSKNESYPDEANAANNALKAAVSVSNKNRAQVTAKNGGSTPYTSLPREMYTSHPPVRPEVEDQNRNDVLRASAIAMAKKMYNQQQKQFDALNQAQASAAAAHGRRLSEDSDEDEPAPMRFNNLQEAAQRLAQERLSKIHDEHAQNREYRDYYGSPPASPSKLSIRGRTRRRSSSFDDHEQSNRIRAQMSTFSSNISHVDAKKRQQDREALLAAAQRNVDKSLHGMDEKIFADTGKVGPSLLNEWELKAHAAAQAKSQARMENHGKINIGGGKFVDQTTVDAAAAKNVQPFLDEINEKAEVERERQATVQLERETQRRKSEETKTREKESKEITKKLKRQEKDEEKMRKADEKAAQKEHRKSLPTKSEEIEPAIKSSDTQRPTTAPAPETSSTIAPIRTSMEDQASLRMRETAGAANSGQPTPFTSATSPKGGSKVTSWIKSKLHKRSSRQKSMSEPAKEENTEKGFVGGHSLTGASINHSTTSLSQSQRSAREVALASPVKTTGAGASSSNTNMHAREQDDSIRGGRSAIRGGGNDDEVSSLSISDMSAPGNGSGTGGEEEFQEARDNFDEAPAPPPTFAAEKKSGSPARAPRFTEDI